MCLLAKRKSNKAICQNYIPGEGLIRETYKSQNIDPISPTLSSSMLVYTSFPLI